jgi:hypothetical protein
MNLPTSPARQVVLAFLLLLLAGPLHAEPESRPPELRFKAGTFYPTGPALLPPGWYQEAAEERSATGRHYLVAITRAGLSQEQRLQLLEAGAEILGYVPVYGYRVRVAPEDAAAVQALPFVSWLGRVPPHAKIQPELSARAEHAGELLDIRVVLWPGEPDDRARRVLRGWVNRSNPSGKDGAWRLEATVPGGALPAALSRLAGLPEVESIERVRPIVGMNQTGAWVHQSFVGPPSFPAETPIFDQGIYGCGQVIAVADTGQDFRSCYFADTTDPPIESCAVPPCPAGTPDLSQRKDILYYNWSPGSPDGDDGACSALTGEGHGTHTSGSAAGDAPPFADCTTFLTAGKNGGDGQAPGAKLVIQEMGDGYQYVASEGGTVWNLADVAHQSGANIHSISWGGVCHDLQLQCVAGCELTYDSFARDTDLAMWEYPDFLMVQAAGNEGQICPPPNAVSTPALAKNSLTVGAVGHGANADFPTGFTSDGPTLDGRLKPEVAAQGQSVISVASDPLNPMSCTTCALSGSSMSAPTAAGLAALAREYYTEGFHAAGVRSPGQGFTPSGALLKATLVDGAVALGLNAPGPDYEAGYGRVLLNRTLAFSGDPFVLRVDDHTEGITTGSVVNHAFDVQAGEPFRATLVWTDYPAALEAAVTRVNELKLEVVDPSGNVWFQTLPGGGPPVQTMNPADPHDHRNVVERLVFPSPAAGRWIVRVLGVDVPMGPQPFALVVRGDMMDCPAPASPGQPDLSHVSDDISIGWSPVGGATGYNVYRSLGACPGGPWVPVLTNHGSVGWVDPGPLSGDVTYSYRVTAVSDAEAACESPPSPCNDIVAQGPCTLPPVFAGVQTAVSAGLETCTVDLAWDDAVPYCGSDVRYNIYRDTTPGFVPLPANRIARCVGGNAFTDSVDLTSGQNHYYVVRAEDAAPGGLGPLGLPGPCRGGNEDGNVVEASVLPQGPPGFGTWTDDAGDTGAAKFQTASTWAIEGSGGDAGPAVYHAVSGSGLCSDLTSPALTLDPDATNPVLTFSTRHDLELDVDIFGSGSLGQVEIATGPNFTNWTRVELSPDYPVLVNSFTNCATTFARVSYFSGNSIGYHTYSASLLDWVGGQIQLRFHLSGDLIIAFGGDWWVDDIQVTETLSDGACSTASAGPPPIPDGASVPGTPMTVSESGNNVVVNWDNSQCAPAEVNVYTGSFADFTTFTGGFCGLSPSGTHLLSIPEDSWFLVAATDGVDTDGSWSRDAAGTELNYSGAAAACPAITTHDASNACP